LNIFTLHLVHITSGSSVSLHEITFAYAALMSSDASSNVEGKLT